MAGDLKENCGLSQAGSIFVVLAATTVAYGNSGLTKVNTEIWETWEHGEYNCEHNDIIADGNDGQSSE